MVDRRSNAAASLTVRYSLPSENFDTQQTFLRPPDRMWVYRSLEQGSNDQEVEVCFSPAQLPVGGVFPLPIILIRMPIPPGKFRVISM